MFSEALWLIRSHQVIYKRRTKSLSGLGALAMEGATAKSVKVAN